MITLLQFPRAKTVPNFSPFCLKLETWLRMANLDYENKFVMNPAKAPKGKLPIIQLGDETYCDSELIIDHLKQQFNVTLDDHLSPEQLAQNYALEILCTERLVWMIAYFRWQDDQGWARTEPYLFGRLPLLIKQVVARMIRNSTIKALRGQGIGRHSKEQLLQLADKALSGISISLGNKAYFGGDTPASVDATAFGCLMNISQSGLDIELSNIADNYPNLNEFCDRMSAQFFAEL